MAADLSPSRSSSPREDEHAPPVPRRDQVREQFALTLLVDGVNAVLHEGRRRVSFGDRDLGGILEQAVRELPDLARERGGEQQALLGLGKQLQHAPNGMNEPHVEHAVRLVEHEQLDARKVDGALPDVIEQPARCGNDNVDAPRERGNLGANVDPADQRRRPKRQMSAVVRDALGDLRGKLAGRREDQRSNHRASARPTQRETLQHG
jgi:hypothetical protein